MIVLADCNNFYFDLTLVKNLERQTSYKSINCLFNLNS